MLAFIFTVSAVPTEAPTLIDLMILAKPYVDCRRTADQKIVVLQQKIQTKKYDNSNYDQYADPDYRNLNEEVLKAENTCDLPRYVSLVKSAIAISVSYDEFQKNKLSEFLIEDIIKLQWTFLTARSGTYSFPKITLDPALEKANK